MRNEYSCGNKSNVLTKKIHLLHLLVGPYRDHSHRLEINCKSIN